MAQAVAQDVLRRELIGATDALLERAIALEPRLIGEAMTWRPPTGGWSVGEVLEHLVISARLYLERMRPLIDSAASSPPATAWRPTLFGGLLVRSMTSTRRFPAPSVFRPGLAPREGVLAAHVADLREVRALLERSARMPWRVMRLSSPASRIIRLNLGDCFALLVRHAERHGRQIDRLLHAQGLDASA